MECQDSLDKTFGLMQAELVFFLPFTKKRLMENLQSVLQKSETSEQRPQLRLQRPQRKVLEMDVASATETVIFFIFATITILGALGLIYAQRVAHSMLSLIFCFMAVSGIFILMGAEFLAAIQILVYLASVGLVVLFGIMLTRRQIQEEDFE
jgi:NADH-quinone oxidoreductase subunit J